jgi:Ca2+-binding RTX toxin-like protein
VVQIVDDVPQISVDSLAVYRTPGVTVGEYDFHVGADTAPFNMSFSAGALAWTNKPTGYEFALKAGTTNTYMATYENGAKNYFEVTIKDNGTYEFKLVTPAPAVVVDSGSLLAGLSGATQKPMSYTFSKSNFNDAFELVLTGYTNGSPKVLNISSSELGVEDGVIHNSNSKDDVLRLDVQQQTGFENATITSLTLGLADTGSLSSGDNLRLTVTYTDQTSAPITLAYDGSGSVKFNIDTSKTVDYVEFDIVSSNVNAKVTGVSLGFTTTINPADALLAFELKGSDADSDTATAAFSVNVMAGTAGDDTISTGVSADRISGGAGNDTISAGGGNDYLDGGAGNDILNGGDGGDTLKGGAGNDTIDGGSGIDLLDLSDASAGLTLTLVQNSGNTTVNLTSVGLGTDTYKNIEGLIGSDFNDVLTGSANGDRLYGGGGPDTISGGGGADTIGGGGGADLLNGGAGSDHLTGGAGADTFVIGPDAPGIADVIADYNRADGDDVDLSELLGNLPSNTILQGNFVRVQDAGGGNANLQVDTDGSAGGGTWHTVAVLEHFQVSSDVVKVLFTENGSKTSQDVH